MTLSSVHSDLNSSCPECGDLVPQSGRGRPRRFCSERCRQRHHNRRTRRSLQPLRTSIMRLCVHCGSEFSPRNRNRIYCYTNWCAQAAYELRRAAGSEPRMATRTVACDECGESFTGRHPSARWCSKKCANRHWGRVRMRGRGKPSAESYIDRDIFERDLWICHLCNEPVDRGSKRSSARGATIDHLVPLSLGGQDIAANVATAHFLCNIRKGTSATNEQLRFV